MSVRAKFKVDAIRRVNSSKGVYDENKKFIRSDPVELRTIEMSPVYGNGDPDHENTKFWNATPTGKLELGCLNLAASEQFELGKEYYIDFTPAD